MQFYGSVARNRRSTGAGKQLSGVAAGEQAKLQEEGAGKRGSGAAAAAAAEREAATDTAAIQNKPI